MPVNPTPLYETKKKGKKMDSKKEEIYEKKENSRETKLNLISQEIKSK